MHTANFTALALALASLAVVALWPKSTAMPMGAQNAGWAQHLRRWAAHVPGTIVVLVVATLAVTLLGLKVDTIGSRFGGIPQSLPAFALPAFSWATAKLLLIPTLTIALLGAIESLLCARVADNLASSNNDFPRHDPNQELMAQGIANMVVPFFGGIPATGTVARTVTNVRAGARSPVAGIVHALTILLVVLVAAPLALNVPLAALAGILMFVAWNMGEWREFVRLQRFSRPYQLVLLGTFLLTVIFDLTVAVEVGLVLACAFFIRRMSQLFRVDALPQADLPPGVQAFELFGSLFFGAVGKVEQLPETVAAGTRAVVLDMHRLISVDASGLDALEGLHRTLARQGIALVLANVNPQPLSIIRRSGFEARLCPEQLVPNLEPASLESATLRARMPTP